MQQNVRGVVNIKFLNQVKKFHVNKILSTVWGFMMYNLGFYFYYGRVLLNIYFCCQPTPNKLIICIVMDISWLKNSEYLLLLFQLMEMSKTKVRG